MDTVKTKENSQPVSPVDPVEQTQQSSMKVIVVVYVLLVLGGVGTGYLLSRSNAGGSSIPESGNVIKSETVAGIADEQTFKDSAEGTLEKGGLDGEGTHKLIREGGESQTAYLISSVVNLDEYIGKRVKVWGETFAAQKASWLMDVGKIELLQ